MSSLAFIHSRSPLAALLGLGILYAITWVVLCVNAARRRSTLARAYCCKPIACYPHREPPFGLDVCLESAWLLRSGQLMPRVAARYRDMGKYTFGMLALGDAVTYTAEPENIRAMLDTQFEDFEGPVRKSGHAIPAVDGDQTGWSRALLSRAFTRRQVRDLEMFDRHVGRFVARIPRHGQTVDLQELFSMLTMDSATEFLLGQSSALLADEVARERGRRFHDAFSCIAECAALEVRLGKLATLMMPSRKLRTAKAFVYEYIGEHVRRAVEARKSGLDAEKEKGEQGRAGPYVFLDELAQTSLGEQEIQDELLSTLSAVRDNTASLLGSTFHVLARRKDVWAKLQREVASLGNETPTFERLQSMKYLQYTLHEGKPSCPGFACPGADVDSSEAPPHRTQQWPRGRQRYHPPRRRGLRPESAHLRPEGDACRLPCLRDAPPQRPLRRRRGGLQAREVGDAEDGLAVSPLQRRTEDVPRAAVRPDRSRVDHCEVVAGFQGGGAEKRGAVGGRGGFDLGDERRAQACDDPGLSGYEEMEGDVAFGEVLGGLRS